MNEKIKKEIAQLKKEKNAVILVHNYQAPEIQDIADFLGDSLDLSNKAATTNADVIVFCGVLFMAETAKILSPQKTVLIPDLSADCPMARMITAEQLRELKKKYPKATVVAYVNTTADVKAECDVCCTSANAQKVVENLLKNHHEIIFVPDKNLGGYVSEKVNHQLILWPGYCASHVKILAENILELKNRHPKAEVLVHPECNLEVRNLADYVLSTNAMCQHAHSSKTKEFIIGTEVGIIYRLQKENPGKQFYAASELALCPNMKKITLEKVLSSLQDQKHEITLDAKIMQKAKASLTKMLGFSK